MKNKLKKERKKNTHAVCIFQFTSLFVSLYTLCFYIKRHFFFTYRLYYSFASVYMYTLKKSYINTKKIKQEECQWVCTFHCLKPHSMPRSSDNPSLVLLCMCIIFFFTFTIKHWGRDVNTSVHTQQTAEVRTFKIIIFLLFKDK